MKVLDSNAGPLTNLEVLRSLQTNGGGDDPADDNGASTSAAKDGASGDGQPANHPSYERVARMQAQLRQYLQSTPAGGQTRESIADFAAAVRGPAAPLQLTQAETLQLVNLQPTTAVELHLLLRNCEQRLDEAARRELLATLEAKLGGQQQEQPPSSS